MSTRDPYLDTYAFSKLDWHLNEHERKADERKRRIKEAIQPEPFSIAEYFQV